ncbi:MAG: hypothetical protein KAG61_09110 [Bacteriovoracaceae bacterium]|nr:hypothetical protein [Bacteriovoracaceae bacterium]
MKSNLMVAFGIIFFAFSYTHSYALESLEIEKIERLIKEHKLADGLNNHQKFSAYAVLARELELYGYLDKSIEIYNKAIKLIPKDIDPLEINSGLLSVLYRHDIKEAKKFFNHSFKKNIALSKSHVKQDLLKHWNKVFSRKISEKDHNGFYGQYFKDMDIKSLMQKKDYKYAFKLVTPKGLKQGNINSKLQYDVISRLNGKRSGFLCESMLTQFKDSSAITMEMCRYLQSKKTKYGNLKSLQKRAEDEMPHLKYLVNAMEDIQ